MQIPVFSLNELCQGKGLDELRTSLRDIGFLYLRDHGIPQTIIDSHFDSSKKFFDSDSKHKESFSYSQLTNAGYLKIGMESLNPGSIAQSDFKEALNFRKDDGINRYPSQLNSSVVSEFVKHCHSACMRILNCYASCLQTPSERGDDTLFSQRHRFEYPSGDVLRYLHYPPTKNHEMIRAGGHSDFGSITLLFTSKDDQGGLQAYLNGQFHSITHLEHHVIVNTGDLLEFWTNSFFKSTIHRVVSTPNSCKSSRYSIAYFCHAENDALIEPVLNKFENEDLETRLANDGAFEDGSITSKLPSRPKTAGQHLQMRLDRIHGTFPK